MQRFKDKFALITGGTNGIGYATAQQFVEEGGFAIVTGRSNASVHKAISRLGERAFGIVSNAGDMQDIFQLQKNVKQFTNNIDLLL